MKRPAAALLVLLISLLPMLVRSAEAHAADMTPWTYLVPENDSSFGPERHWVGPDGSTWAVMVPNAASEGILRDVVRISADGKPSFTKTFPIYVYSLTFDSMGTAYLAGMDATTDPISVRVYSVTSSGVITQLGRYPWNNNQDGPVSVAMGPSSKLYLQVHEDLRILNPATGSVESEDHVPGSSSGPTGAFIETNATGINFYDYYGDYGRRFLYGHLDTPIDMVPATALDYARPSWSQDGGLLVTGYVSTGPTTDCSQIHAERFNPKGVQLFDIDMSLLLPGVVSCQTFGGVALPNGESAVALLTDDADARVVVVWLGADGRQVARVEPDVDLAWRPFLTGDIQSDQDGRVVLAYSTAGLCDSIAVQGNFCSKVNVRTYLRGAQLGATAIEGDGDVDSQTRVVRAAYSHLELPTLQLGDNVAVVQTGYEPYDCGQPNCFAFGYRSAYDSVVVPATRPTWKDPTQSSAPPAQPTSRPIKDLLILGDSYSAGNGAGFYIKGSPKGCYRSSMNYGSIFAQKLGLPAGAVRNFACSGAPSEAFTKPFKKQPAQVDAITGKEDLIMLTVGGDDYGIFQKVVKQCLVPVSDDMKKCDQSLTQAEDYTGRGLLKGGKRHKLGTSIHDVLTAIRKKNSRASIVLLGYPYLDRSATFKVDKKPVGSRLRGVSDSADADGRAAVTGMHDKKIIFVSQTKLSTKLSKHVQKKVALSQHAPNKRKFTRDTWFVEPLRAFSGDTYFHPTLAGWTAEGLLLYYSPEVPQRVSS